MCKRIMDMENRDKHATSSSSRSQNEGDIASLL